MKHNSIILLIVLLLLCLSLCAVSAAWASEPADAVIALGDQPGGVWSGVPARPALRKQDPVWSLRTGFRKGITDQSLDEEAFAGPDAAVLRAGAAAPWTGLLAEYRESAVFVEPDNIAGLSATKPLLIIPSGGLAGLSSSNFFRAGLAEYVRSGGIVLCFAQQKGGDYAALPVPDGSKTVVAGAGWSEDSGPLFRASSLQSAHPIFAELRKSVPSVETDGYLTTYPESGRALLARQDGFPTLVLYAFGKGWIAVTTLMSDVSFEQGLLAEDERVLLRGMVLWAKSGGRVARIKAGKLLTANIGIRGPVEGRPASVKIMVMGPSDDKPKHEQTYALDLNAPPKGSLPVSYGIPADAPPGIYHVEYILLDEKKRPMTSPAESGDEWFEVIPQSPPPSPVTKASRPWEVVPVSFSAVPSFDHRGDRVKIDLTITRTSGPAGKYDLITRIAGQDGKVRITQEKGSASVELPAGQAGDRISYALYNADGRSLARGSVSIVAPRKSGISVDREWYAPGQKIRISVRGMGAGELSVTGLGSTHGDYIKRDKVFEMPVPEALPSGVYPITWEFKTTAGTHQEGEIPISVQGAQVTCKDASVMLQQPRSSASDHGIVSFFLEPGSAIRAECAAGRPRWQGASRQGNGCFACSGRQ